MVRSVLSKVAWVGRTASMVFGLALVMALVMGAATMAFADNGANLILGSLDNTATAVTKLTGNVAGAEALHVSNPNTARNSTALSLNTATGKPPMKVNRTAKVNLLNADYVDGLDSTAFQGSNATAGGDLTGNYPNPQLADGAVGSAEVANGSLRVGDIAASSLDFSWDFDSIAAGGCHNIILTPTFFPAAQVGDLPIYIPPPEIPTGKLVGSIRRVSSNGTTFSMCNLSDSAIDVPNATYNFIFLRP